MKVGCIVDTDLSQIRSIVPLALSGDDPETPSRARTLPDGRMVRPGRMLVRLTRRFACGDFETSTGLVMANMNGLCVCETRVLVRMEVQQVSLSVDIVLITVK
jgi:hypothetical protein